MKGAELQNTSEHPVEKVKTLFLQQPQQPQTISLHVGILPALQAGQGTSCFLSLALRTMKIIALIFVTHTKKATRFPSHLHQEKKYIYYIYIQTQTYWNKLLKRKLTPIRNTTHFTASPKP